MTKLEKLLAGCPATYEGDKVIFVKQFSHPEDKSNILMVYVDEYGIDSRWFDVKEVEDIEILEEDNQSSNSTPRTIEQGLVQGDIVIDADNDKYEVLGICGRVIFLSDDNNFNVASNQFTLEELINFDYKLYQPEEEDIVELTFQEISEGKGKGVNPKLLKIKE
jgi:hypothetical protein